LFLIHLSPRTPTLLPYTTLFRSDCFPDSFDYVALGHLHRPQAASGRDTVRYSGSPIPLSFSEAADRKEARVVDFAGGDLACHARSEEHTSELQSRVDLVCRLLLE